MLQGLTLFIPDSTNVEDLARRPCNQRLEMALDTRIFRQLTNVEGRAVPKGGRLVDDPTVTLYWLPEDIKVNVIDGEGTIQYGADQLARPLTFIRAAEFLRLRLPGDLHPDNRRVVAEIRDLPGATPIILYWH